jgi:hypothetical protein
MVYVEMMDGTAFKAGWISSDSDVAHSNLLHLGAEVLFTDDIDNDTWARITGAVHVNVAHIKYIEETR